MAQTALFKAIIEKNLRKTLKTQDHAYDNHVSERVNSMLLSFLQDVFLLPINCFFVLFCRLRYVILNYLQNTHTFFVFVAQDRSWSSFQMA